MGLTKIKRSRIDSRHKRKFNQREKRKGHSINEKRKVDDEVKRQKFAEEEVEQKKREQFIEKKKKLNELMHERIERQKAIRDTFKGIIMDGEGFKSGIQDQGQDEIDELEAINKLELKDVLLPSKHISVHKLMKKLLSGNGGVNELIKINLVMSCLEKGTVTSSGNQQLKEIKDLQAFYKFFITSCPKLMVDAFISQELKEKQDEYQKKAEEMMKSTKKRNQKETKEDGQESAISVENRSFILKYLIMFPSIFKMTEGENAVDIDNLGRLLSVVKTEKLGVKAISMLIVAISDKEKVKILIEKYLKWNAIAHSKSTEVVLNSFVALLIYSDINRDIIDSLLNSCIEILPSILHGKLLHHSHNFIKSLCRRFKHKMHRAKSETSEKYLDEIISSSFIQIIKHVLKYINKIESIYEGNNFAHDNYQLLLELLTDVINFMGADITIFTPFVFQIVKLYHKILHSCQVNLSLRGKTSSMSLSSFIILMLEKNDAFFCKNQDRQKTEKQGADNKVKGVRLTNEQLNNPNLINKYFQDLLNLLKVSVGLYYNSGRNIAFPEFSSTITFRLRKIIQSYDELLLNLKNKNANEEHKDSRIPIYSARQKKIEKIISSIQKCAKATLQVRNQYAKTVNVETHQLLKMIDYCGTGYELDQPGLYKEAINMITNK